MLAQPLLRLQSNLVKWIDLHYLLRFILVFVALYYFNIFFLGITTPDGKFYSSFLKNNMNYIAGFSSSILYASQFFLSLFHFDAYIEGTQIIRSSNAAVEVWFPCLGLGISSFWVAFVVAHKISMKNKFLWCIAGLSVIWFINCWRIALLLLALDKKWYSDSIIDHHTAFNIIAYVAIGFMIFSFVKKTGKPSRTVV